MSAASCGPSIVGDVHVSSEPRADHLEMEIWEREEVGDCAAESVGELAEES